eukprot:5255132-Alexandrium_andersonii.AAC.1
MSCALLGRPRCAPRLHGHEPRGSVLRPYASSGAPTSPCSGARRSSYLVPPAGSGQSFGVSSATP